MHLLAYKGPPSLHQQLLQAVSEASRKSLRTDALSRISVTIISDAESSLIQRLFASLVFFCLRGKQEDGQLEIEICRYQKKTPEIYTDLL